MAHADFVHLRVHSAYSLSEGALKIPQLLALCREHNMPAVAVTDTGNLFGVLEFSMAAAKEGVQPIVGCQLYVARPGSETGVAVQDSVHKRLDQLVLLVQDEDGYRNLLKLVSKAYLETEPGARAHVQLEDVEALSGGLIALTGGPEGAVGALLADGQMEAAVAMLERLMKAFPDRLYVELMRHGLTVEEKIEGDLIDLAFEHDLPLVATNDCYFAGEGMYEAHDALLCIAEGAHIGDEKRRRLTRQHGFRTPAEMRALFADVPEAIDNTVAIARRCAFMPERRKEILPPFPTESGRTEAEQLRVEAKEGLASRLEFLGISGDEAVPYKERLDFELDVIIQMDFPGYFLIVADFIQWAKNEGIPVGPGRGSGAGSVVAWSLTITDLDPLRFDLLFERFLNPERVSMPDFDIDFCQDRRDEVIGYVQRKYGADKVAQIITFGKLQARAVLRDVGRVLGMPYGQVDRISKLVPFNPANPPTLKEALEAEPELRRQREQDEQVGRLIDIGMQLEGLYRHASTHAAGVVIGDRPLQELVPLYRDPRSEMAVTQFSMKYVETAGLVKFDFLGLKTLTVLSKAVEFCAQKGVHIDLGALPLDDQKTYEMLGRGETVGVFQLESAGMRDALRNMKADRFEDIIALVALYRPGPMDNIPRYNACKAGLEEPDYLHPKLEPILKETFGVMIYQEQVMQIAQVLSGYSLGGADLLRRAMGKKIKAEMEAQRDTFVKGAVERGVDEAKAGQIFDQVDKFAGYGFNKSHAAAYALVAYQTAWLKANHPVEFLAAIMTLDLGNTEKLNVFKQELERLSIPLLPPDINDSEGEFSVRQQPDGQGAVRYALGAIKGVGVQAMDAVVEERTENGPYKDAFDFAERVGGKAANKRQLENLIRAGAFDGLDKNRRKLFEGAEKLVRMAAAAERDRETNQVSLFDAQPEAIASTRPSLPEIEDWPVLEKLNEELNAVGFYLSAHPLDAYGGALKRVGVVPFSGLTPSAAGSQPKLAGVVVAKRERTSARGNRFAFIQFSGPDGMFEVVAFSEALGAGRELLESGKPILISCEARADNGELKLSAQGFEDLDAAVARTGAGLKVRLAQPDALAAIKRTVEKSRKGGKGRVSLVLDIGDAQEVEVALPGGYSISAEMRAAIDAVPGVLELQDT